MDERKKEILINLLSIKSRTKVELQTLLGLSPEDVDESTYKLQKDGLLSRSKEGKNGDEFALTPRFFFITSLSARIKKPLENLYPEMTPSNWLPESVGYIYSKDEISSLNLSFCGIKSFKDLPELNKFQTIKRLYLRGNRISTLEDFPLLFELEILDLANNSLISVKNVPPLPKLKAINLSNNAGLKEIDLRTLPNLSKLELQSCKIQDLKEFHFPDNLDLLDLGYNELKKVSKNIPPNLRYLYLKSNQIQDLHELPSLPNLEVLLLGRNKIKEISNLNRVPLVTDLDFSNNPISEINGLESLSQLQSVDFDGTLIPERIRSRINQKGERENGALFVDYCRAKYKRRQGKSYIPHLMIGDKIFEVEYNTLSICYVDLQRLSELKEFIMLAPQLEEFYCVGNSIQEIELLDKCKDLRVLDLSYNNIREVKGLEKLSNLEILKLSYNNIQDIKDLSELPKLKKLWLDHNQIYNFEAQNSFPCLEELYIENNQIIDMRGLSTLNKLQKVDFSNNRLTELAGLGNLIDLRELRVSGNKFAKKFVWGGINENGFVEDINLAREFCIRSKS